MREGIHPNYPAANVSCACGNSFVTKSTRGDFTVDVCSACHPFYTGTQKLIDAAGRVDRFRKRYATDSKATTQRNASNTTAKSKAPPALEGAEASAEAPAAEAPPAEG